MLLRGPSLPPSVAAVETAPHFGPSFYIARAQGAVTVRLDLWMNSRSLPPSDFLTLFGTDPPS